MGSRKVHLMAKMHFFEKKMLKNFVSSKKSSTFAAGFQKLECSGSPEILIFWESVAQHGALYKGIARSRASVNASAVSLAQLVEQLTLNQWVEGSSPSGDTTKSHPLRVAFLVVLYPEVRSPEGAERPSAFGRSGLRLERSKKQKIYLEDCIFCCIFARFLQ